MILRLRLLFFLFSFAFSASSQDLSNQLIGQWALVSKTLDGDIPIESITWNTTRAVDTLYFAFSQGKKYTSSYKKDFVEFKDSVSYSFDNSLLLLTQYSSTQKYLVEKLTKNSLQLLQIDLTASHIQNMGENIIHHRYVLKRLSTDDLSTFGAKAQITDQDPLIVTEAAPEFPGGVEKLFKFIRGNLKYPREALKKRVSGIVMVSFIISPTGEVTDIEIVRAPRLDMAIEVVRVMKDMPHWIPGRQNDKPVFVHYTLPVRFQY